MHEGWSFFKHILSPKPLRKAAAPVVLILLVALLLAGFSARAAPVQVYAGAPESVLALQEATPTAQIQPTLTPTNSQEIDNNREQTTGIIVGAIFLMLIIVGGTLLMERALREQ